MRGAGPQRPTDAPLGVAPGLRRCILRRVENPRMRLPGLLPPAQPPRRSCLPVGLERLRKRELPHVRPLPHALVSPSGHRSRDSGRAGAARLPVLPGSGHVTPAQDSGPSARAGLRRLAVRGLGGSPAMCRCELCRARRDRRSAACAAGPTGRPRGPTCAETAPVLRGYLELSERTRVRAGWSEKQEWKRRHFAPARPHLRLRPRASGPSLWRVSPLPFWVPHVHHSCARGLKPIGPSRLSCGPLSPPRCCRGPNFRLVPRPIGRPDQYPSLLCPFPPGRAPAALPARPPPAVVADRFLAARQSRRRLRTFRVHLMDVRFVWLPFRAPLS
jgi:hypothetical protein